MGGLTQLIDLKSVIFVQNLSQCCTGSLKSKAGGPTCIAVLVEGRTRVDNETGSARLKMFSKSYLADFP